MNNKKMKFYFPADYFPRKSSFNFGNVEKFPSLKYSARFFAILFGGTHLVYV